MSEKKGLNRRDFLKIGGMAAVTVPAAVTVANIGKREIISSAEASSGFYIKEHEVGNPPYTLDDAQYSRPGIVDTGNMMQMKGVKDLPGFTHLDYAFDYAAAMHSNNIKYSWTQQGSGMMLGVGNVMALGRWDHTKDGYSQEDLCRIVKRAAGFFGASEAGIARVDERWFYSEMMPPMQMPEMTKPGEDGPNMQDIMKRIMSTERPKPARIVFEDVEEAREFKDGKRVIPKSMKYAIVMALEMDADAYSCETTALSMAASVNGYSRMAFTATTLAEFIRALGYKAIPMGNDTALSQPMAIDAGLGEISRAGLLITPKYGARVRLCKVLTDMPLIPDKPISFGVFEFCKICGKCADFCPSKSIPTLEDMKEPTFKASSSGSPGVLRWGVNGKKCGDFWGQNGSECHTCIRVCPFTKPDGWLHDITKALISMESGMVNKLILKMDDAAGYGKEKGKSPRDFWLKMDNYIHVKA